MVPMAPSSTCTRPSSTAPWAPCCTVRRSEEHTSELQSRLHLVCRLLLEKKKTRTTSLSFARQVVYSISKISCPSSITNSLTCPSHVTLYSPVSLLQLCFSYLSSFKAFKI